MAELRVLRTRGSPVEVDGVLAFTLDQPQPGTINFDGTLRLAGWIIGREQPPAEHDTALMKKLQAFDPSKGPIRGA